MTRKLQGQRDDGVKNWQCAANGEITIHRRAEHWRGMGGKPNQIAALGAQMPVKNGR